MKTLLAVVLLCSLCSAQDQKYWTPRRIAETAGVTVLHMADAAQTCYHMTQPDNREDGLGTPHNCAGAAVYLVSVGPVLQWTSYKLTQHYRWMRPLDRALPYVEMSISVNAIRCSNMSGCNRDGF